MTNQDIFIDHREDDYSASALLCALRHSRDLKIAKTDWTQLPDVPDETKTKYQAYRQELRDITKTYKSLKEVVWPEEPF